MERIKGKDVNLFIDGATIAGSTSCTFTLTANTADGASKSDPGDGMWDNPEFTNYSWQTGNESFVVSTASLRTLLEKVIRGDATVDVSFQDTVFDIALQGKAIITQLQVSAPNGDKATLSLSLEGCTPLTVATDGFDAEYLTTTPLRGKALMLALQDADGVYRTLAASTSHSLTVSVQTAETTTKDDNDKSTYKEVTGKSVSLSTENLLATRQSATTRGVLFMDLLQPATNGDTLKLAFGYYADSVGHEAGADADWGASEDVLLTGDFICSSISANAAVKDNATYTAEFACKGMPIVNGATT